MTGLDHALRAERVTLLATPAARMLLGASMFMAAASLSANLAAVERSAIDDDWAIRAALHSSTVATLIFSLVAGVYSATTDHRFGLADQRALSQPHRRVLVAAKSIAAAAIGLLYAVLGAITALGAGYVNFAARNSTLDFGSSLVWRPLLGIMVAAPLFAIVGVALGTLVRNQPIAIGGSLAWLLLVEPAALLGLPSVGRWLPGASGLALTFAPDPNLLTQLGGALVLSLITAAIVVASVMSYKRADI